MAPGVTFRERLRAYRDVRAPGGVRGCPHRYLPVPLWDGCDGTPEACSLCWGRTVPPGV